MPTRDKIVLSDAEICNSCFMILEEGPAKYSPGEGYYHEDCGDGIESMYRLMGRSIEMRPVTIKYVGCAKRSARL